MAHQNKPVKSPQPPRQNERGSNLSNPHGYQSNGKKKNRDFTPI